MQGDEEGGLQGEDGAPVVMKSGGSCAPWGCLRTCRSLGGAACLSQHLLDAAVIAGSARLTLSTTCAAHSHHGTGPEGFGLGLLRLAEPTSFGSGDRGRQSDASYPHDPCRIAWNLLWRS